jgi:hypothetical protein
MLLNVLVILMYCGLLDIAHSLEHHGNPYCVFVPIFSALVFAVYGVQVSDSLRQYVCEPGTLDTSPSTALN